MAATLSLHARIPAALGYLLDWTAPTAAAWCWGQAVAAEPRSAELHFARAQAFARCLRWREAARSYTMAAHLAPANVEYQGSLVVALQRTGADEAALEALRRFADLRPGDGEVHVLLGTLQRRCGRPAEALRSFRLAVTLGRPQVPRRFLLGEILLGAAAWEEALAALGLAGQSGAGASPASEERSALNFQPRRATPAAPALRSLPRRPPLRHRLAALVCAPVALAAAVHRRVDEAGGRLSAMLATGQRLRAMRRAARQIRAERSRRRLALWLLLAGGCGAADAAGAALSAPGRASTAAGREQARLCERLRGEEAVEACRSALALGVGPTRQAAVRQRLALHLVALERWQEVADVHAEAVRQDPNDAAAWQRLGLTQLYALGAPAEALGALREAERLAPAEAETHLALGMALAALGRYADAVVELENAKALDPRALDARPGARAILEAARRGKAWP